MKIPFFILFTFQSLLLFSLERVPLFTPVEDHPFFLNSPGGVFSLESSEAPWEKKWSLRTQGKGDNVQMTALDLANFSLKDRQLILWVKAEKTDQLREFWLFAADSGDFENRIVYMISDDRTQLIEGEWVKITMPLSAGKIWGSPDLENLNAFQIWINDRGQSEETSIDIGPIYTEQSDLPSALVMTFDDGWLSQKETAAPLMAEYGMKGTAYIIPDLIGQEHYMTTEDLQTLTEDYGWSLGSHFSERLDSLNRENLMDLFEKQTRWFEERNYEAPDFSYPNGAFGTALLQTLPAYYRSGRTIIEYPETLPPADPYKLRVINIVPPVDRERLRERLERMSPRGELIILVFHKIEDESTVETELAKEDFRQICALISETGAAVKTMAEVSRIFLPSKIEDWEPFAADAIGTVKIENRKDDSEYLSKPNPGTPEVEKVNETTFDFSMDWRMVWGQSEGEARYYSQLDDLHMYIKHDLNEFTALYSVFGIEEVNFEDFSQGAIDGSYFYLNSLYMVNTVFDDTELTAGYTAPDPHHKWLQVTRSAGIEPAFGQTMTPRSLWIGGKWEGLSPYGIQLAAVPDFIGVDNPAGGGKVMTYQESLGIPNIFGSIWIDTEQFDMELAGSVNGDSLKIASAGGYYYDFDPLVLSTSLGIKYTGGEEFSSYPEWDHQDGAYHLSSGVSLRYPLGLVTLNPGLAYKLLIRSGSDMNHMAGLDMGIIYNSLEFYGVLTFFELDNPGWGSNTGLETGLILEHRGVEYMAGYTMAGFNALSGLYNNKDWNEGGVDGLFLRIKATYW